MTLIKMLESMSACSEGMTWIEESKCKTIQEAWERCPRADWMLWFIERRGVGRKDAVKIACICARTALKYVHKGEDRPRKAIEAAEKWLIGRATIEEVKAAAYEAAYAAKAAAYAAAYAANAAAYAAAYADYAVANAAAYAANAAAYEAAYEANAAAYAATAAANAAAYEAAYEANAAEYADYAAKMKALKKMANLIRKEFPKVPKKRKEV